MTLRLVFDWFFGQCSRSSIGVFAAQKHVLHHYAREDASTGVGEPYCLIATVENFTIGASLSQLRAVIASRTTVFRAVKFLREGGRVLCAKHQCCDGVTAEDQRVESNDESLFRVTALLTGGKICST